MKDITSLLNGYILLKQRNYRLENLNLIDFQLS